MSKIKAVHSRFSYYITWGKEIGDANGENSKEERSMIGGLGALRDKKRRCAWRGGSLSLFFLQV